MKTYNQLEMFDMPNDTRISRLHRWMWKQIYLFPQWVPSAREIQKIADDFKVIDVRVLDAYEEERPTALEELEIDIEEEEIRLEEFQQDNS